MDMKRYINMSMSYSRIKIHIDTNSELLETIYTKICEGNKMRGGRQYIIKLVNVQSPLPLFLPLYHIFKVKV